jgi:hypothetical protein
MWHIYQYCRPLARISSIIISQYSKNKTALSPSSLGQECLDNFRILVEIESKWMMFDGAAIER